ncbi:MAG: SLBB domain-containing protein, partial [Bacillota bacterium]
MSKKYIPLMVLILIIFTISIVSANSYELNKGDQISISVWGHSDLKQETIVSPNGNISFPLIGTLKAEGLTTTELKNNITEKLNEYIKDPEVNINILEHKKSKIMIMGEVKNPGTYPIEENDKIINVISRAGGPTQVADLSQINLKRENKSKYYNLEESFDDNKEKENSYSKNNVKVKDKDVIYIPKSTIKVTVLGEVKKPGQYDLKKGSKISNIIAQAGGLTEMASNEATFSSGNKKEKIQVNNITSGKSNDNKVLKDGDEIFVPRTTQQVSILGEVNKPGSYNWHKKLRLTELLAQAGNYTNKGDIKEIKISNPEKETQKINLMKYLENGNNNANPLLKPGDTIVIPELESGAKVTILGEINKPGHYAWEKGLQLADLIAQAGNKTDRANLKKIQLISKDGD